MLRNQHKQVRIALKQTENIVLTIYYEFKHREHHNMFKIMDKFTNEKISKAGKCFCTK